MKRLFASIFALLLVMSELLAAPAERIYVSTDRNIYLAGEDVWCSLFLMDCSGRTLSPYSAVSYLELISADGCAATAKIALVEGRGAGCFRIPASTPSGNYRLVAYTASQSAESRPFGSRILSIFNVSSASRVKDGVTLVSEDEYLSLTTPEREQSGPVGIDIQATIRRGNSVKLSLANSGAFPASVSVSIHKKDKSLIEPANDGPAAFIRLLPESPDDSGSEIAEFEGEIITAVTRDAPEGSVVTLSSAGIVPDIYLGRTDEQGRVRFFTNNLYGQKELVCEVRGVDNAIIRFEDRFTHPHPGIITPLVLSSAQKEDLLERKASLKVGSVPDTLLSFLPRRQNGFLEGLNPVVYHLDDYTRFDSFREVVVEILREIQMREIRGKKELVMIVTDPASLRRNTVDNILVLLDGVVISDIRTLEDLDANLFEDVYIYGTGITLGGLSFNGVVNFVTKNQHVKAVRFPSNVIVSDFDGASYPTALLCGFNGDERMNLIYWNPVVNLQPGETLNIPLGVPRAAGQFIIVAEGFTQDGIPVSISSEFEIR